MTLLPFTKLQHQKMKVYRFGFPLIAGCVRYLWIISKGQMLPLVRAWNLLAQGELSDAMLLTATPQWSRKKMVQPGRMDSLK